MKRMRPVAVALAAISVLCVVSVVSWAKASLTFCMPDRVHDAERIVVYRNWAERFSQANPGVEVEVLPILDPYYDKLKVMIAAGSPSVDVMWMGMNLFGMYAYFQPLDELWAKDAAIKDIHPVALSQCRWQGRLLAIPFGINTHTVYYNKDLLSRAGLAFPRDGWTWGDAIRMAKALTRDLTGDGEPDQWGMHMSDPVLAWSYGGSLFAKDGRSIISDDPMRMAGMSVWADLVSGRAGVNALTGDARSNMLAERAAMMNTGPWNIPYFWDQAQFDWDVVAMPYVEHKGERSRTTFTSPEAWAVAANSRSVESAKEFLRFIMQREQMLELHALRIAVPTQTKIAGKAFLGVSPPENLIAFVEAMDYAGEQFWAHPAYDGFVAILTGGLSREMWRGSTPVEVALPEIGRQVNARIGEFFSREAQQ